MDETRLYDRTITEVEIWGGKIHLRLSNINASYVGQKHLIDNVWLDFTYDGFDQWVAGVRRNIEAQKEAEIQYRTKLKSIDQETGMDIMDGPYEL